MGVSIREQIRQSPYFVEGQPFTAKYLRSRLDAPTERIRRELYELKDRGELIQIDSTRFQKTPEKHWIHTTRWSEQRLRSLCERFWLPAS